MGNRDKAKELREKQAATKAEETKEALASEGSVAKAEEALVKTQEELENALLINKDLESQKEGLEAEIDALEKQNIQLEAMLEKCKAEAQTEVTALKKEIAALKKK